MNKKILYQANQNYIMRKIAGEEVLVAIGAGVADFSGYIRMNTTASAIWKLLQEKVSEEQIINAMYEKYDASLEQITADVQGTLKALISKKMVTVHGE